MTNRLLLALIVIALVFGGFYLGTQMTAEPTPLEECIERAERRAESDIDRAIRSLNCKEAHS